MYQELEGSRFLLIINRRNTKSSLHSRRKNGDVKRIEERMMKDG